MNILLIGAGGREHALAWKMAQSPLTDSLFISPGNAGTAQVGTNIELDINNHDAFTAWLASNHIEMVVVGPEQPLVEGIHNRIKEDPATSHIHVVGPKKAGAKLEGSKAFAKEFLLKNNIPTAQYKDFSENQVQQAQDFLEELKPPFVLKADGLAAGKGVLILDDLHQAKEEVANMLGGKFGQASKKLVIEEFLDGIEMSVFILTDGTHYKILPSAKDYKRIGEKDTGLNTGGMGAISPVSFVDKTLEDKIETQIIQPTLKGLKKENIEYSGFLFIGLMIVEGNPYVIEYNVRMGDPETEVVIPRIESDLVALLKATCLGTLDQEELKISSKHAATVFAVSAGYPEKYEKNKEIQGIEEVQSPSIVFQAGTTQNNGSTRTNGGRVLAITSLEDNWKKSLESSYGAMQKVCFEGIYYRKDIGFDL